MSNAILPLVLLGSIGGSVAAVAYGVKTDWEFLGGKDKEPEYTPPAQEALMSGSSGGVGSLIVDDFVVTGDEQDMTMIGDDGEDFTDSLPHEPVYDSDDTNISALTGMPINCPDTEDDGQSAMRGFKFYENSSKNVYGYQCSTLENPGSLQFGKVGNYKSHRGDISDLHGSQALCASNQALVGFVLDQNKSGTKSGYRYDCIDIKGPAKVRTAITSYKPYDSGEDAAADGGNVPTKQLKTLTDMDNISCREGELLQGFATEKSGNNMRYIYRCITPGYEAD
jgi:hypothetical protein